MSRVWVRLAAGAVALAAGAAALTTASVSAEATTPACGNASLAITHIPAQGAAGHGSFVLLYRNITHANCTIYGYPGLDALNASGHVLAHATRTLHGYAGGGSLSTVTLAPNGFASATVEWMNFNPVTSGSCAFSTSVATTPANTTHTVRFAMAVSVCDLQVHPTVAGTSGNNAFALAQQQWIGGATAISANQGIYWTRAENDLKTTATLFGTPISWLKGLIALPDANQTAAQNAAYHKYISELNTFFGTPGLYA